MTSPVEVNLQPTDEEEESEQEIFDRKALSKQRAIEEEEQELSTKVTEVIEIPLNSAVYSVGQLRKLHEKEMSRTQIPYLKL